MLDYLLKSGVCLAVFYLFYKLLLEKEPIHIFKRVYLLGGLLLAFAIPLITFTTVVEIDPIEYIPYSFSEIPFEQQTTQEISTINYWPIILWTVYGFGVTVFGLKFLFNLYHIGSKIRRNTKQKVNQFTHVLLQNLSTPHTFFSYIFLNKQRYLQHQIPQEVFWHEETHAKQKHSFDVIFLELLQVVFWFNPLLYFIKKDIKLNHEFLADRAVLNKGVPLTVYQEILLAFSANPAEPLPNNVGITNALNYSSIKKRFAIMKTKTSQKAVWIKSLILLPLLAMLIYSFSEKVTIEKVTEPLSTSENLNSFKDEIRIYINKNKEVIIENKPVAFSAISTELMRISKKTANNQPKIYVEVEGHLESPFLDELEKELSKSNLPIYQIKATTLTLNETYKNAFNKNIIFTADSLVMNLKNGEKIVGISKPKKSQQDKATPEEIAEYNKLAKKYNAIPTDKMIVKQKDLERINYIYKKMTDAQKQQAENYPAFKFPPLPNNDKIIKFAIPNYELQKLVSEYNTIKAKQNVSQNIEVSKKLTEQVKFLENSINKELEKISDTTEKKHQDKATAKELAEYNKLAKKYNAQSEGKRIVKLQELNRLEYIFDKMTVKQKQNAEPFPNFQPKPVKTGYKVKNGHEEIIEVPVREEVIEGEEVEKISSEELGYYNTLVEKINKRIAKNKPLKQKDVLFIKRFYNKLPINQRKFAMDLPNFPPKPVKTGYKVKNGHEEIIEVPVKNPPPPPIKIGHEEKEKRLKAIENYAKIHPDKVTKSKDENGNIIEVVEMPIDDKGWIQINNKDHYYVTKNGKTTYYNRYGQEVDKNGKLKKVIDKQEN